jgi:hypothetical protein
VSSGILGLAEEADHEVKAVIENYVKFVCKILIMIAAGSDASDGEGYRWLGTLGRPKIIN